MRTLLVLLLTLASLSARAQGLREIRLDSIALERIQIDAPRNLAYGVTSSGTLVRGALDSPSWETLALDIDSYFIDHNSRLWFLRSGGLYYEDEQRKIVRTNFWNYVRGFGGGDGVLYAVGDDLLRRSVDGGTTWTDVNPAGFPAWPIVEEIIDRPGHPENLFAFDANGLHFSTNSGASWTKSALIQNNRTYPFTPDQIVFDPANAASLFALYAGQLFYSRDGAATWAKVNTPSLPTLCTLYGAACSPVAITSIVWTAEGKLYAATRKGLFVSSDRAARWSEVPVDGAGGRPLSGLVVSGARLLVVDATRGVRSTTDGGVSWTRSGFTLSSAIDSAAVDPSNSDHLFSSAEGLVFESFDGGRNWTAHHEAIVSHIVKPTSLTIDPSNSRRISTVSWWDLLVSVDGGASWQLHFGPPRRSGDFSYFKMLVVDWERSTRYFLSSTGAYRRGFAETAWTPIGAGVIDPERTNAFLVDPRDGTTLYDAMNEFGVFVSRDGGATWAKQTEGLPYPAGFNVYALATDGERIFAGTGAGVFVSNDQARSWTRFSAQPAGTDQRLAWDATTKRLFASGMNGQSAYLGVLDQNGRYQSMIAPGRIADLTATAGRLLVRTADGRLFTLAMRKRPIDR